ncbi:DNA-(apurinic or apyrimidinic site) lyase [Haloactinopolyspora alba]|uniref:Formamidopyrimidine-DNA glycosylase n=1 Tax=Haloactinopolyspora alba TaxID=648780 RepID=A0A2P8E8S9_9ACTN|nr:bifunctional DNA-formamidopyrimidine glycosylase/DNA-(apurinic or apyrimidinic site) lyase [Haloactinopolyspora alba]PSL05892.1 DNA-(apurinic or apyrimidinic site) lyase [Haloactinopolyspora alba]
MPELPEVEVVRRGVAEHVSGRVIARVEVAHPRAVRRHAAGARDFADLLAKKAVLGVHRRGKYLWLPLDDHRHAVVGHLGMSGQLLVQPAAAPDERHLRVRFAFTDGDPELRFVDQRTFGGFAVAPAGPDGVPEPIAHIAPDPMDEAFDDDGFAARLARRRTGVKRALLDQSMVSGVGNIYADEALWLARLHYARPTETLRRADVDRLLQSLREVMAAALAQGGTSFDSLYVDVNGESGYFDRALHVYGRAGEPCRRCAAPVRRDPFMNRSSYTCPHCQPRPRRARW